MKWYVQLKVMTVYFQHSSDTAVFLTKNEIKAVKKLVFKVVQTTMSIQKMNTDFRRPMYTRVTTVLALATYLVTYFLARDFSVRSVLMEMEQTKESQKNITACPPQVTPHLRHIRLISCPLLPHLTVHL